MMKSILKKFIARSRVLKLFKDNNQLIILNYHRILDPNKVRLFDDGVFGPTQERFEQEMKWLKKETDIISEDELIDIIYNKKKINRVKSLVTFDDGYRDNYDLAYPVLKKLNIPAIFFIPTKQIEERKLGWWDITAFLVKHSTLPEIELGGDKYFFKNKPETILKIINKIKRMNADNVDAFLIELSTKLKVDLPSIQLQDNELMTWDQIIEVNKNGITIGSHTHEHAVLSNQNINRMREQIKKSKNILETKLGHSVNTIAYPVGGYRHFNQDAKNVSKELGFKLGYSFLTGVNHFPEIDPFDVRRGSSQNYWDNLDLALAFPNRVFVEEKELI